MGVRGDRGEERVKEARSGGAEGVETGERERVGEKKKLESDGCGSSGSSPGLSLARPRPMVSRRVAMRGQTGESARGEEGGCVGWAQWTGGEGGGTWQGAIGPAGLWLAAPAALTWRGGVAAAYGPGREPCADRVTWYARLNKCTDRVPAY